MKAPRFFDLFNLFGPPKFSGPVTTDDVAVNPKLRNAIVGMWTARKMDTDQIGAELVIPEHVVCQVLRIEREKQRAGA